MFGSEVWNEVAMYFGALFAGASLFFFKKIAKWVSVRWRKLSGHHSRYPEAKYFTMDRNVHDLLVEMRSRLNGDRACFYQFHNGQVFSSSNPIWRISCTHESCAAGVSHEMTNRQSVLASSLPDLLGIMFSTATSLTGVSKLPAANEKATHFLFDIDELRDSFWRSILVAGGAQLVCVAPITDGGQVIGFVSVCYRYKHSVKVEELECITDFAAQILFELKRVQ